VNDGEDVLHEEQVQCSRCCVYSTGAGGSAIVADAKMLSILVELEGSATEANESAGDEAST